MPVPVVCVRKVRVRMLQRRMAVQVLVGGACSYREVMVMRVVNIVAMGMYMIVLQWCVHMGVCVALGQVQQHADPHQSPTP